MKVYIVSFGDMECDNLLAIFSTREKAEEYLAPYYELEKLYGKDCVEFFYPHIHEKEIDLIEEPFQFYSEVIKYKTGYIWRIKRVDYIPLEQVLEQDTIGGSRYRTASLVEEEVKLGASKFFLEKVEWIVFK
jgi:hypothetical protein